MSIDIENIKPVEYDDCDCSGNETAKCPYCGYENNILAEDYGGQDECQEDECGECGRHYIRQTDYRITFDTVPLENHAIEEIKDKERMIANGIEWLGKCKPGNKKGAQSQIDWEISELNSIKKKYLKMLEENAEVGNE